MTDTVAGTAGLTAADVAERVAAGRTNAFRADTSRSVWSIVRANVFTLFNAIVFSAFLLLLVLGRWQDALFGLAAIFNMLIGAVQEYRAKRALDRLALLNAPRARVQRDGAEIEIAPAEVVIDDLLVLRAGDQVPADATVTTERGLQIDESMLTGESDPVDKQLGADALSGSVVVGGEGSARVVRVGAESYANTFASEARRFSLVASELRRGVDRVLKVVTWTVGPIGLLVLNAQMQVFGGWREAIASGEWVQAAVNAIAAITAMIPLGLVLMTSIAFAVGAAKLASKQVLVNELPAVEGLARVDVICLDKTGTLTGGDIVFDAAHPLDGAPGECADVLAWFGAARDANATARCLREPYPVSRPLDAAASVPFSSARKWSAVSFASGVAPGTWVMGAPEMVFGDDAADDTTPLGGAVVPLAAAGKRTLVLARSTTPLSEADVDAERLPAGVEAAMVLTFEEEVRPDAADTLSYFARQGVGVKIISGDSPRTVAAIARQVGLNAAEGFDARRLPTDEATLADVLDREVVFGRVTPDQKKRMVEALQSRGHTVAMTGDGVNDALAIKTADLGIAMNSGAAATKAVARVVLLDGRFSHLPDVVAEGRQVIANIERVSMLFLTKTAYITMLSLVFGIFLLQFPFLPRQLSVTDGLTIGIPAFFLALLPNAQRYLPGFLVRSLTFALPAGVVIAAGLTAFTVWARTEGLPEEAVRSGATLLLGVMGIWVLTVVSRPFTLVKGVIAAAMIVGLVLVYAVPPVGDFFQLSLPRPPVALTIAIIAVAAIIGIEIVRFSQRRFLARRAARGMGGAEVGTTPTTG